MHRLTRFLILGIFSIAWLGCAAPEPEPIANTVAPLYVDTMEGGHGPFPCIGAIPDHGYARINGIDGNGNVVCQQWLADLDGGSQWNGYQIFFDWGTFVYGLTSIQFSPHSTTGVVCQNGRDRTYLTPCNNQQIANGGSGHDIAFPLSFWPYSLVLEYDPECPQTSGINTFHQCPASVQRYDGSSYLSGMLTNGIVAPGLPRGQPIYLKNDPSLNTTCKANTAAYGFPFTPPAGYPYGNVMALVYTCGD